MQIACLLRNMFEDSEYEKPVEAFRQAGHEVTVISDKAGEELHGLRGQVRVRTEMTFDQARPPDFDALFLPGSFSPDRSRISRAAIDFARTFFEFGKPVFAISEAPALLIAADVVTATGLELGEVGPRLTAWPTVQDDLRRMGANVEDSEVVVDRNLVTARRPEAIPAFVRESLAVLERYQQAVGPRPGRR